MVAVLWVSLQTMRRARNNTDPNSASSLFQCNYGAGPEGSSFPNPGRADEANQVGSGLKPGKARLLADETLVDSCGLVLCWFRVAGFAAGLGLSDGSFCRVWGNVAWGCAS